jgi:hypothetical protein
MLLTLEDASCKESVVPEYAEVAVAEAREE